MEQFIKDFIEADADVYSNKVAGHQVDKYHDPAKWNISHRAHISCATQYLERMKEFANFIGNRPLPEYSESTGKWRWWSNEKREYEFATTDQLLELFIKTINQ